MSTGTEGEWYSFGSSFFPAGEGSCLVWETTLLDHGDIPTGFGRIFGHRYIALDQIFVMPFYLFSMPNFDICCMWVFILTAREGLIVVDFMPFTRGFEWLCLSGKIISLESTHGEANKSIIFRNPSTKLFPVMVFQFSLLQSRVLLLVSSGTPLITPLRLVSKSSWQARMDSK